MSKKYLSIGNTLINPDLLAYAIVDDSGPDGLELRLGFVAQAGGRNDLLLVGEEAGEVLRWLRLNADFLSKQGPFYPNSPIRPLHREYRKVERHASRHEPELVGRY